MDSWSKEKRRPADYWALSGGSRATETAADIYIGTDARLSSMILTSSTSRQALTGWRFLLEK